MLNNEQKKDLDFNYRVVAEYATLKRLITQVYPSGIVSIVSDSFNLWSVCDPILPKLKDIIMNRDGKVVIRPDSGDPADILCGMEQIDCRKEVNDYCNDNDIKERNLDMVFAIIRNNKNLEDKEYLLRFDYKAVRPLTYNFASIPMYDKVEETYYLKIKLSTNLQYNKIIHFYNPVTNQYSLVNEDKQWSYKPIPSELGIVELLWNVFGGTITDKGYKLLDPHIGVIYGDSITLDRAKNIFSRLEQKGFASQVVFGVGSFQYQYNTRDTFGIAVKATYVEIDGEGKNIFKDPVTDDGTKKSAVGLLRVDKDENGEYILKDQCTKEEEEGGELISVFLDGHLLRDYTFEEVKNNCKL